MFSNDSLNMANSVQVAATIQAVALAASGKLLGMIITPSAATGTIVFRTDGPGTAVVLTVPTPGSANDIQYVTLPATLNFSNGLHVTLTNVTKVELLLA